MTDFNPMRITKARMFFDMVSSSQLLQSRKRRPQRLPAVACHGRARVSLGPFATRAEQGSCFITCELRTICRSPTSFRKMDHPVLVGDMEARPVGPVLIGDFPCASREPTVRSQTVLLRTEQNRCRHCF